MKVLTPDPGLKNYRRVFSKLKDSQSIMVIWQLFPENGRRVIHESHLFSFDPESKILLLQAIDEYLDPSLPLYAYVEDGQLIFKSALAEAKDDHLAIHFPKEMKLLDEEDVDVVRVNIGMDISTVWRSKKLEMNNTDLGADYILVKSMAQRSSRDQDFLKGEFDQHLTLDQEEKLFEDQRESKRMRPKVQKRVRVRRALGDDDGSDFQLFDLSQGGMGFVCSDAELFPKSQAVVVMGFDDFMLDDPLIGTVVAIRALDDSEDFKIGIKFSEGQA